MFVRFLTWWGRWLMVLYICLRLRDAGSADKVMALMTCLFVAVYANSLRYMPRWKERGRLVLTLVASAIPAALVATMAINADWEVASLIAVFFLLDHARLALRPTMNKWLEKERRDEAWENNYWNRQASEALHSARLGRLSNEQRQSAIDMDWDFYFQVTELNRERMRADFARRDTSQMRGLKQNVGLPYPNGAQSSKEGSANADERARLKREGPSAVPGQWRPDPQDPDLLAWWAGDVITKHRKTKENNEAASPQTSPTPITSATQGGDQDLDGTSTQANAEENWAYDRELADEYGRSFEDPYA